MMIGRINSSPFWFLLAFVPMVASQIARLYQTTALGWIICDYSGRLAALAILAAIPAARAAAFRPQQRRAPWWEIAVWVIVLATGYHAFSGWLASKVDSWVPNTLLGLYYPPDGWLRYFDLVFGLGLVAFHEEIIFRRCARSVFNPGAGDGVRMIIITSLLFAVYHWTTGLGNIVSVFFFGIYMMCFYRRSGLLWPLVLAHFVADFIALY
jgi:uncharacterized protein